MYKLTSNKTSLSGQATNFHFLGKMGVQNHKSAAILLLSGHADFLSILNFNKDIEL